ncbi:MAG: ATP-binding cassette domain-containing protein [Streptosporangiales bacterium]|nr:ATP-binding cassette domain-containing protein [Streptosporangiales bacterium]
MRVLAIDGLAKTYEGAPAPVLSDVDLSVPEGQFICVLGPSGCGKTTLIRIVSQLIDPDTGTVQVAGSDTYRPGEDVCMVFQDHGLFPWYTVAKNIEYGLRIRHFPAQERKARVDRYLELIGLTGFGGRYPDQLSGGMRQRVGLARALACEPRVLLLDEPFAAVDAQTRERLQDELLGLWEQQKMTVLFVTHSIDEAAYLSDRVIVLRTLARQETDDLSPSICDDVVSELPRPRDRTTEAYREMLVRLRASLERAGG